MIRHRLADERGVVLIAGLLLTVALLMVIGAAVDIGNAFIVHRQLVNIADDAALAGSQQLDLTALHEGTVALDPAQAQSAALETLTGYEKITASAQASPGAIDVSLEETTPTILLRLVGLDTFHLRTSASAAPRQP
jgi:Flp pilus assembly protein TadG